MAAQRDEFERAVSEFAATALGAAVLGWNRLQACRRSAVRDDAGAPTEPPSRGGRENEIIALLDRLVRTATSRLRTPPVR